MRAHVVGHPETIQHVSETRRLSENSQETAVQPGVTEAALT